jgi:hypothetical protein
MLLGLVCQKKIGADCNDQKKKDKKDIPDKQ